MHALAIKYLKLRALLGLGYYLAEFGLSSNKFNRSESAIISAYVRYRFSHSRPKVRIQYGVDSNIRTYGTIGSNDIDVIWLTELILDYMKPGPHKFNLISIGDDDEVDKQSRDFELILNPPTVELLKGINDEYIKPDRIELSLWVIDIDKSGKGSLFYKIDQEDPITLESNINYYTPYDCHTFIEAKNLKLGAHSIEIWANDNFYNSSIIEKHFVLQKYPDVEFEDTKLVFYYKTIENFSINYHVKIDEHEKINVTLLLCNSTYNKEIDQSGRYSLNQSLSNLSIGNHSIQIEIQNQYLSVQKIYNISVIPNQIILYAYINSTNLNKYNDELINAKITYKDPNAKCTLSLYFKFNNAKEINETVFDVQDSSLQTFDLPINIPQNLEEGKNLIKFWATDNYNGKSQTIEIPFNFSYYLKTYYFGAQKHYKIIYFTLLHIIPLIISRNKI